MIISDSWYRFHSRLWQWLQNTTLWTGLKLLNDIWWWCSFCLIIYIFTLFYSIFCSEVWKDTQMWQTKRTPCTWSCISLGHIILLFFPYIYSLRLVQPKAYLKGEFWYFLVKLVMFMHIWKCKWFKLGRGFGVAPRSSLTCLQWHSCNAIVTSNANVTVTYCTVRVLFCC